MSVHGSTLRVQVIQNGQRIGEYTFDKFPIIFGRSDDCHLSLKGYSFVSRTHGSIAIQKDQIQITDLNSSNGILYKNSRVPKFTLHQEGVFQVEELTFKLSLVSALTPKSMEKTELGSHRESSASKVPFDISKKDPAEEVPFEWRQIDFSLLPDPEISSLKLREMCLQGAIIWQGEIYDVRNFNLGERIRLGPSQTEPLYLPIAKGELDFGIFSLKGAKVLIPKDLRWLIYREGHGIPFDQLNEASRIKDANSQYRLILALNEVVSVDIGFGMEFRLRYVPIPRPLINKTWIENRDEFKRAISISLAVHFTLSVIAVVMAPKSSGPKVQDVPQRFAKLLVEPPKQTFAFESSPPPPPVVEEPEPEPPPPVEHPKVVEQKPPKAKKKIVKKEKPKPMMKAVQKVPPRPPQPQPSSEEKAAAEMANLFNSMSGPAGGSAGGPAKHGPITINKGAGTPSPSGVRVAGVASAAANAAGSGSGTGLGEGLGLGAKAGQMGYATSTSTKAGKRGVVGAVVGVPSFKGVQATQGITNDEVMKVVNRYLAEVHRCYERALFNNADIVGRVEYEWEINPTGTVDTVAVKRSEVANGDFLNSCVMGVFKKMKFPAAKNGQPTTANIGFPFGKN